MLKYVVIIVFMYLCILNTSLKMNVRRVRPNQMSKFTGDASLYEILERNVHSKLEETVQKHCKCINSFEQYNTIATHTTEAYNEACDFIDTFYRGKKGTDRVVILDSGCGKGLSTFIIGNQNPGIPVIGIDRSISRLSKNELYGWGERASHSGGKGNVLLLRAELADFWTLVLKESNWKIHSHYVLYPNPYPKAKHLSRRWHGHAVFPHLLALGGIVHVRSNWDIYCEEMKLAVDTALPYFPAWMSSSCEASVGPYKYKRDATAGACRVGKESEGEGVEAQEECCRFLPAPMTHFERKYMHLNVPLYESVTRLPVMSPSQRQECLQHLLSAEMGRGMRK